MVPDIHNNDQKQLTFNGTMLETGMLYGADFNFDDTLELTILSLEEADAIKEERLR